MDWVEASGASLRDDLSGSGNGTLVLIHEEKRQYSDLS